MLRSSVLRRRERVVRPRLPDANVNRMRAELEGVGVGCGSFEQRQDAFRSLLTPGRELFGCSEGSMIYVT